MTAHRHISRHRVAGVTAALAAAIAMACDAGPARARGEQPVKCYGVAKAGENDCAADMADHACAGLSTIDYYGGDWSLVPRGTCESRGGALEPFDGIGTPQTAESPN